MPRPTLPGPGRTITFALLLLALASPARASDPIGDHLARALSGLDAREIPSGVLLERVAPVAGLGRFDGGASAPAADLATWRQAVDELRRAAIAGSALPDRELLRARERAARTAGEIPIALLLARYDRLRPDALASGALEVREGRLARGRGEAFESGRAFVAAALRPRTYRGGDARFVIRSGDLLGDDAAAIASLEADLDDGLGFRPVRLDEPFAARYRAVGPRTLAVRATLAGGERLEARATFAVAALAAPLPDDTLHVTASVPYEGAPASGRAYVRLGAGHAAIENPIVVVEGFDLDNSLGWDELHELLNQEALVETLTARGYDAVVLDFDEATDPVVRNGLLVAELVQQVQAAIAPEATLGLVGASMGALCSRYALAWLESQAFPHRVRTWISYDGPHLGAVIPLGLQYWVNFFSGQSVDAAFLRDRLNTPAARDMLLHHFTVPPTATGVPDPRRAAMEAAFAAVGGWPALARKVAFANGSGGGASQGFAPGAQIIRYQYSIPLIATIRGNVWAVPDQVSKQIFEGRIQVLLDNTQQNVTVSGTRPLDGAPGGSRATMTQMDTTAVPYGDIEALYPAHCFIPVTSAVAVDAANLFEPLASDPLILDRTEFDAVHFAPVNQEHVTIDAAQAAALLDELELDLVAAPAPGASAGVALASPRPNPSRGEARLAFRLARAGAASLRIVGVDGRAVATLARGRLEAGSHERAWDGRDDRGREAPAGLYFAVLEAAGVRRAARIVHLPR